MRLLNELRRRNVLRMAALYIAAAWLVVQVATGLIELGVLPARMGPWVIVVLAIGFPIALLSSWFFEVTPEGVSLEKDIPEGQSATHASGRRMDFVIIAILSAGLIMFAYDKWWPDGPMEQSIAVLAFENRSGDLEQEYFSDGISEDILTLLARIEPLKVIARTSSFSFKDKDADIATIAAQLKVRHVLEGSVRRAGDRLRVTAQLIDATDSTQVWSQTYDRDLGDIFAVQDEIAAAITDALKVNLAVDEASGEPIELASIKTDSDEAYDAYLQGRELFRQRNNLQEAIQLLERSISLDDSFAPAHAQLAQVWTLSAYWSGMTPEEVGRIAIPLLDRADELQPNLAETHGGRALLADLLGDFESEVRHARKALAVNPSYGDAMNWLYLALHQLGRYQEAEIALKQFLVIDPLTLVGRHNYTLWLYEQGEIEEARKIADQLDPGWRQYAHAEISLSIGDVPDGLSWGLQGSHANSYVIVALVQVGEFNEARRDNRWYQDYFIDLAEGRYDEAIRRTQEGLLSNPDSDMAIAMAANALYLAGRFEEALPLFERLLEFAPEGRPLGSWGNGHMYWVQPVPLVKTMQLALTRRRAGNEEGAQAALKIVVTDHAARRAAGTIYHRQYQAEAMVAAFEHDPDRAIAALETAIDRGLRDRWFFDDPIFEEMSKVPRFIALRNKLDEILAVEHEEVLQLICFNNPADEWQPLPETCEGVTRD